MCVCRHGVHVCARAHACTCVHWHLCACMCACRYRRVCVRKRVCRQVSVHAWACPDWGCVDVCTRLYTRVHACSGAVLSALTIYNPFFSSQALTRCGGACGGPTRRSPRLRSQASQKRVIFFFFPNSSPAELHFPYFWGGKEGVWGGSFAAAALRSVGGGGGRGLGSFFLICSLHCTTMLRKIISPQRRAGEHKKKNGKKSETRGRGGGGRAGKGRPLRAKPFGDEPGSSLSLAVTPFFHSPPSCSWEPHGAPKLPPQNPAHYKSPPPLPWTRPGFGCHRMPTAGYRGAGTRATSLGAPITAAE